MAEKRTSQQVAGTKPTRQRPKRLGSLRRRPSWEQRFKELESFKKEYGHCNVPYNYRPNLALGHWVSYIRKRKKGGQLDTKRVGCLNALGFCWALWETWDQHIHDLKAFKKKHGHCNVPWRYPLNPGLGWWVNGVRQWKKRGEVAENKIRALDALSFCWAMKPRGVQVPWEQRLKDLKAFKKKHGHYNVPFGYQPNPTLGRWVANLRQRKKHGTLAEEKILLLDALGFCWVRQETSKQPKKPT